MRDCLVIEVRKRKLAAHCHCAIGRMALGKRPQSVNELHVAKVDVDG